MTATTRRAGLLVGLGAVAACRNADSTVQRATASLRKAPAATAYASPLGPDAGSVPAVHAEHSSPTTTASECNEQAPQQFLVTAHHNGRPLGTAAQRAEWKSAVARSIRYRTEQFGYYPGFGSQAWNTTPLASQLHNTKFLGLTVRLHEKVIPALHCVERALRTECAEHPYLPHALSGARSKNTYFDGDVSNHVYGIAIDLDPLENPCCGCIEPWRSSPRCRGEKTDFERMDMPACWVKVFERFGFYWLGHDVLRDTMHFEFLGDPEQILKP